MPQERDNTRRRVKKLLEEDTNECTGETVPLVVGGDIRTITTQSGKFVLSVKARER